MPDEHDEERSDAIAALRSVAESDQWTHLSGTGVAARSRSRRMRRTRYAATAGSAMAVAGVAVLVASTFGGGGSVDASPAAHRTSAAPTTPITPTAPHPAKTTTAPPTPTPTPTTKSGPTMGTMYYDKWKTCPIENLIVGPDYPGASAPPASTKAWVDACRRMVAALSALDPAADVSPAPASWQVPDVRVLPPSGTLGRDDPPPAHTIPSMGAALYRIEDAKGTVELAFHSDPPISGKPAGAVPIAMVDGLHAWVAPPKPDGKGGQTLGEFYVTDATGQHNAYALLMGAPSTYTAQDFTTLVTTPGFEQMMAGNLAEPGF